MVSAAYKKAVQGMWKGKATVTVLAGALNPANGRTEPTESVTVSDAPCRISHTTIKSTQPSEEAAAVAQSVTLYICL